MNDFNWEDAFPPLDISAVARAIAEASRRTWEEADRAVSPYWHGRPPVYPYGPFEKLYEAIVDVLKQYDHGRTETLKFYKNELIRLHNCIIRPPMLLIEKEKKGE